MPTIPVPEEHARAIANGLSTARTYAVVNHVVDDQDNAYYMLVRPCLNRTSANTVAVAPKIHLRKEKEVEDGAPDFKGEDPLENLVTSKFSTTDFTERDHRRLKIQKDSKEFHCASIRGLIHDQAVYDYIMECCNSVVPGCIGTAIPYALQQNLSHGFPPEEIAEYLHEGDDDPMPGGEDEVPGHVAGMSMADDDGEPELEQATFTAQDNTADDDEGDGLGEEEPEWDGPSEDQEEPSATEEETQA